MFGNDDRNLRIVLSILRIILIHQTTNQGVLMSALEDAVAKISADVATEIAALAAAVAAGDPVVTQASVDKLNALSAALEASVAPAPAPAPAA